MALKLSPNSWETVPEDTRFSVKYIPATNVILLHCLNDEGQPSIQACASEREVYNRINSLVEGQGGFRLGKAIATITKALGIRECGACAARRARLNRL